MSDDVGLPGLPQRQPQQALEALRDQPPFVTPWPVSPGVSGWFHPPGTSSTSTTTPEAEWPEDEPMEHPTSTSASEP